MSLSIGSLGKQRLHRSGAALACTLTAIMLVLAPAAARAQRADTVVKLAGRPVHAGLATLTAEISIGTMEGAEEYMFGEVSDIAVARDGSIYVYDSMVPAIRKYDANGRFVRNVGRRGQGPGEYLSGAGMALLPDDRLLLWDTRNWRINVYSPAGESVTSWSTPSGLSGNSTFSTTRALSVDTAGFVYYRKPLFNRQPGSSNNVVIRLHPDGRVRDTIAEPRFSYEPRELRASSSDGRSQSSAVLPFDPRPVWTISPHGYLVTGVPDRYAFELRNGTQVVSIRRTVQPEPVSAAERNEARKRIEDQMRRTDPRWNWNGPEMSRSKPYYNALAVGRDGRIWVNVAPESAPRRLGNANLGGSSARLGGALRPPSTSESNTPAKPALYDVFEPTGVYLGRVQVPPRVATLVRRGDYVWGVAYDENDVATVKRYRINWR